MRAERFHIAAAFDDGAAARRAPDGAQDRQRRAGRDAASSGDNHHRDGGPDIMGERQRDQRGGEREVHQPGSQAVGEFLDGGARAFGLLDSIDDPAEDRVAAEPLGADLEHAGVVGGAREDRRARQLFDGRGFAGDAGLIDGGAAGHDGAIHGDLSRRPDHDNIARLHFGDGQFQHAAVAPDHCRLGQKVQQILNGLPPAVDGQVFQHLRAQHEEEDEEGGGELFDGQCRRQRQGHGEFHGHPAGYQVVHGFAENGIPSHECGRE